MQTVSFSENLFIAAMCVQSKIGNVLDHAEARSDICILHTSQKEKAN
jgi:hypothetical protein